MLKANGVRELVDLEEIHRKLWSENPKEIKNTLKELRANFAVLPNKKQVWGDLVKLTSDEDAYIRWRAVEELENAFQHVPEKEIVWNDLVRLVSHEDTYVRNRAAATLRIAFRYVPEKRKAWKDLVRLISNKENCIRGRIETALGIAFQFVPEKQKVWEDLHRLTLDEESIVRRRSVVALGIAFQFVPEKQKAWEDLKRLISDKESTVRDRTEVVLEDAFKHMPEKQKAWKDLVELTSHENRNTRVLAAKVLKYVSKYVPKKQKAWDDLVKLTSHEDWYVRCKIVETLWHVSEHVPEKGKVWEDLIGLTSSNDCYVRRRGVTTLRIVFKYVPDKQKALEDLVTLTLDVDSYVRLETVFVLWYGFKYVPNRQKTWKDLVGLTLDENSYVRREAVTALWNVFKHVPDKQKAWEDLHKLTLHDDSDLRWKASQELHDVYQHVPEKKEVCEDLQRLASDEDSYVKVGANHSLGRICIYNASKSENENVFFNELEKAIKFFERASINATSYNPSIFCLPFYLSFYTIISDEKKQAKDEVDKYLDVAKNAIKGSKSKKLLLEAVDNLSKALKEVQNIEKIGFEAKKGELNFYRKYCDQAAELMKNTEEKAPFATATMKKGLPILDRKLKSLLEEIQEKAKTACRESQGTDTEEIACAVSREVQKWEMGTEDEMIQKIENLIFILKSKIPNSPENKFIFDKIEEIRHERNITKQYETVALIIGAIPSQVSSEKPKIREELVITTGVQLAGTGAQHVVTIPLQDISYSDLLEDLGKIKGKGGIKFSDIPRKLAEKLKGCLRKNEMDHVLEEGYLEISTESRSFEK